MMWNLLEKYFKIQNFKNSFLSFFIVGVFVFTAVVLSNGYGFFYGIENFFEDILFSTKPVNSSILILEIDSQSIEKIGQWPWKREVFARAFSQLDVYKPRAVGFDIMMSEVSRFGQEDDALLAKSLSKVSYPVVMPVEALNLNIDRTASSFSEIFLKPLLPFQKQQSVFLGHVNLINDRDGIVRSLPFRVEGSQGDVYEGLAYKTIEKSGLEVKENSNIKPVERIVFSGQSGSVRRIPFWKILEKDVPPEVFQDKIIFIGVTAPDLHDEKPTPFDKGTQMSGVEIQSQIGNMFLSGYRLRDLNTTALLFWFLIAVLIPCLSFYFFQKVQRAILLNVLIGFIHSVVVIVLFDAGIVSSFVYVNISWVLATSASFFNRFLNTDREKKEIRAIFSKYVSKDVLDEILKDTSKVKLGGEEKDVTIFFSDIRNFTTLSEGMSPSHLTNFLNKYLTRMTNIILKRKGVVDKYIGDAIMSFWGAPIDDEDHALDAVLTCLDIIDSLDEFNEESKKSGDPEIGIGIGLNTGKVTVGNMGSEARFNYTIMGDAVNLASRLEGQTKTYRVKILISESTKNKINAEDVEKYKISIRELDRITVKGKTKPVTIFEVVPRGKEKDISVILDDFNRMRTFYYDGRWKESLAVAEKILKKTEDGPTKILTERCLYFSEHEPESWSGVYEMKSK